MRRMGNDPKKVLTNRLGQTDHVSNVYVADASAFVNVTDNRQPFQS